MQALVAGLPAGQVVMVVDTCHAGGAAKAMPSLVVSGDGVKLRTGTVTPDPAKLTSGPGFGAESGRHFAVLAASQADELSLEDPPRGGLFTSRLLAALASAKGEKPLGQVFAEQVKPVVLKDSEALCKRSGCRQQTPMFAYSGRGNLIRL